MKRNEKQSKNATKRSNMKNISSNNTTNSCRDCSNNESRNMDCK